MIGIGLLTGTISAFIGLLIPRIAWIAILVPVTLVPMGLGYFYFDAMDGVCFATARTAGFECSLTSQMVQLAETSAPEVISAMLTHLLMSIGIILAVRTCQKFTRWVERSIDARDNARRQSVLEKQRADLEKVAQAILERNRKAQEARDAAMNDLLARGKVALQKKSETASAEASDKAGMPARSAA
ncbi:MAG: hypothetical protein KDI98_07120 [Hyphomicrobiaceae bacterium]|nr:hypothetical protein [Hyphomicrobiaceae bacterium]